MWKALLITGAILYASMAQATSPIAQVICDQSDAMELKLQRSHGAQRQGQGLRDRDTVLELWSVPATGAWTIVQRYADGKSCIVAMGEAWQSLTPDADPV